MNAWVADDSLNLTNFVNWSEGQVEDDFTIPHSKLHEIRFIDRNQIITKTIDTTRITVRNWYYKVQVIFMYITKNLFIFKYISINVNAFQN